MIILLISLASLFFISNAFFVFKYLRLKKGLKEYNSVGTGRYRFYNSGSTYKSIVYVKELDRFSNGYSKIKLDSIETYETSDFNIDQSISNAKKNFLTLKLTNNINWLEGEDNIRRIRKAKLEKLKNL